MLSESFDNMDQFFAAVEQRDNPELKGKPIAVGHDAERGVVSTASYEARRFGVHSAQSIQVAKRLCPQLIIVEPHFQRYKEVSAQLHEIFHDYTDLIDRPAEGGENLGSRAEDGREDAPDGYFHRPGAEEYVAHPADAGVW